MTTTTATFRRRSLRDELTILRAQVRVVTDRRQGRHIEQPPPRARPPWMKLRPCHAPDCRVTGARPARLATALASRRPSSGIWVSRPAATPWTRPAREGIRAVLGVGVAGAVTPVREKY